MTEFVDVYLHWCASTSSITMTSPWARWRLKPPASWLFTQPFIQAHMKENIKAPRHWPLCGEFIGDRWIPRTKGQWRGKCFHLMTSSCKWFYLGLLSQEVHFIIKMPGANPILNRNKFRKPFCGIITICGPKSWDMGCATSYALSLNIKWQNGIV